MPHDAEYYRKRRGNTDTPSVKCLECGKLFIIIGVHLTYKHSMTALEYKLKHGLPINQGLITPRVKETKRKQVKQNGTIQNILKDNGKRFVKGRDMSDFKTTRPHYAHRQGK